MNATWSIALIDKEVHWVHKASPIEQECDCAKEGRDEIEILVPQPRV